jgi:trans-2,3-dihydro-3-hydroxyanthranilate isomerase
MRYLHYDVFTDRTFQGNQLAVFPDATRLTAGQMQTLAREMNFSESTFILPAEAPGTDVRVRIFTPGQELPMAGHPTIGSTFALADEGVIAVGRARFVFGLGIGPTPVELAWKNGRLDFAWMDQRPPDIRRPASNDVDIVRAAGVDAAAVVRTGLPIEEISCGVPFVFVPVDSVDAVDAAEPDMGALRRLASACSSASDSAGRVGETSGGHIGVFVFTTATSDPAVTAYSRMFAPGLGAGEDPATGGATGPLGCYLVTHGCVDAGATTEMVSVQGVKMGRPSRLYVRITREASGAIARVQVGGRAVRVATGEMIVAAL